MQWEHILFVAIIALIFFGGKKIPEIMGGLGRGVKEFKKATKDIQEDLSIKDQLRAIPELPNGAVNEF